MPWFESCGQRLYLWGIFGNSGFEMGSRYWDLEGLWDIVSPGCGGRGQALRLRAGAVISQEFPVGFWIYGRTIGYALKGAGARYNVSLKYEDTVPGEWEAVGTMEIIDAMTDWTRLPIIINDIDGGVGDEDCHRLETGGYRKFLTGVRIENTGSVPIPLDDFTGRGWSPELARYRYVIIPPDRWSELWGSPEDGGGAAPASPSPELRMLSQLTSRMQKLDRHLQFIEDGLRDAGVIKDNNTKQQKKPNKS